VAVRGRRRALVCPCKPGARLPGGAEDGGSIGNAFRFALRETHLDGSTQRDEVVHYPNAEYPESCIDLRTDPYELDNS
jgi:hypothetical protein